MKKRKDFKSLKNNLKVKDKNKIIRKEQLHAREKQRLQKKLNQNTEKLLKNLKIQFQNLLQLPFNSLPSSPSSSMDFVKTNVLIVRKKIKLSKKKVQAKFLSLPDNLKERKNLKIQKPERNQEIQSQEVNLQCIILTLMKPTKIIDKST